MLVRTGTASILYSSQSIITSLFSSLHYSVHVAYYLLLDQDAMWTVSSSYTCEIIAGKRVEAEKHNDAFLPNKYGFRKKNLCETA